jgi:CRP-like cAMP-binding protein
VEPAATKRIESALRASRLFGPLEASLVAALARTAVRRQFRRGTALWRAGEPATCFTVISRGLVEIVRRGADGSDTIVAIFGPRESIGDMAALEQGPYPADAIALTQEVEVLAVPASSVLEAMRSSPEIAAAVNVSLIEHTRALQEKIRIVTAGSVPKRLATLILHLVGRFGDDLEDGSISVPVALSRGELARIVGATVETTIRTMSLWSKQGLVLTTPQGFVVHDVNALRTIAASGAVDESER